MIVSDCELLRVINYRVCVIDEAHRLKNRNCKLLTGGRFFVYIIYTKTKRIFYYENKIICRFIIVLV